MANSHVQGLSLRTQVHVMNIARTTAGISKTVSAGTGARTNQLHRCATADLPKGAGELSPIAWLDPPGYLVQPNVGNISE